MPLQLVEPRRLYRQVAEQLRQLIDSGEFPVGCRLPTERELAAKLGISRPTVREALIALEVDGRVRIRVGSGIYVLAAREPMATPDLTVAGPFEILAARALFEGAIAERVAGCATREDAAAIDRALRQMQCISVSGPQSIAADRAFHLTVAGVLGNDAVTKVVGDLFDQRINPYFARLASYFETASSWRMACDEHAAIRDRIVAADPAGARAAMQTHLERSQERFSHTFGEAPVSNPVRPAKPIGRSTPQKRLQAEEMTVKPRRKSP